MILCYFIDCAIVRSVNRGSRTIQQNNMLEFPPDIKSKIPKLSAQELEFFTEAKKLTSKFENLFSSNSIPSASVTAKVMLSLETTPDAVKLKATLAAILGNITALNAAGGVFFNPAMPNNFISSMKLANMANDIDVKMGVTTNSTDNTKKTFGEFAKYKMMTDCVTDAATKYTSNPSLDMSSIIQPINDSMIAGTICQYFFAIDNQVTIVNDAFTMFQSMRAQVEEFASLSSLKSLFNNPISNALLAGDISKGIPAIATPKMLELLRLPPKF